MKIKTVPHAAYLSLRAAFDSIATIIQGAYVCGQRPRPSDAELADLIIAEYSSKRAEQYEASSRASVAESVNETLRDWIKAANQFAWAHERHCPRHDSEAACTCGLDSFLSRRRPFIESYKEELAAARAEAYEQGKRADAAEDHGRVVRASVAEYMEKFRDAFVLKEPNRLIALEEKLRIAAGIIEAAPHDYCQMQTEPHCQDCHRPRRGHYWDSKWAVDGTCKDERGRPEPTSWTPVDPLPCNCWKSRAVVTLADASPQPLAVMHKDFIAGLRAGKVMAGWFEGGTAEQVRTEIDVQIYCAESNGVADGMPICCKPSDASPQPESGE